jgi:hypothetical protein
MLAPKGLPAQTGCGAALKEHKAGEKLFVD